MSIVLDATVLSQLCVPRRNPALVSWFESLLRLDEGAVSVVVPEIADYEVRRGLLELALREGRTETKAIQRLDAIQGLCRYLPLDTSTMQRAALLWAQARRRGRPTAPPLGLDADAILAAQAQAVGGTIITDNIRHLEQFGPAKRWQDIDPEALG